MKVVLVSSPEGVIERVNLLLGEVRGAGGRGSRGECLLILQLVEPTPDQGGLAEAGRGGFKGQLADKVECVHLVLFVRYQWGPTASSGAAAIND
jgi:hypothetical protein